MIDCLIIGFNDLDIDHHVSLTRAMGVESGAWRDLNLAIVDHDGRPHHALGLLSALHHEGGPQPAQPFHNSDFLWPTIAYLGSYLRRRGFRVDHCNRFRFEKEALRQKLQRGDVRSVAITTTLYVTPEPILEVAAFVRQHGPGVKIIIGGPYIANNTRTLDEASLHRFYRLLDADFYVDSSEGEGALAAILTALIADGPLAGIDNIAWRHGDGYRRNGQRPERNDLSAEPVRYDWYPPAANGFVSLRTAKSCPFACAFCGFPARAGKYVYLDVARVEAEFDALRAASSGPLTLTILDDTFNVPRNRFKALLRMMIDKGYGLRWNAYFRADYGDEETVALMAGAGCEGVFLGMESGSDTILEKMKKTARTRHYRAMIPLFKKQGILTHVNLVVGFPGETWETVGETLRFIEETAPDFYRAQLWYADPMTPVWKQQRALNIRGGGFTWSHRTMDSRTACDLVERLFCGIDNAIWLPQYGFELWSVFYLQRLGMGIDRIKNYLRHFNAIIRDRLHHPDRRSPDRGRIEALRAAARFQDPPRPLIKAAVDGGSRYRAAETFWCRLFSGPPAPPVWPPANGDSRAEMHRLTPPKAEMARLSDRLGVPEEAIALAAAGFVLLRLGGYETVDLLLGHGDRPGLPVRLSLNPRRGLGHWAIRFHRLTTRARRHAHLAAHFLPNRQRLAHYGAQPPRCRVGFAQSEIEAETVRRAGVGLLIRFRPGGRGGPRLDLNLAGERLRSDIVVDLQRRLTRLMRETVQRPAAMIDDLDRDVEERPAAIQADRVEVFDFCGLE